MQRATANNPRQQRQLETLEPLIAEKLAELKQTIGLRQNQGFESAAEVVLTDEGKKPYG